MEIDRIWEMPNSNTFKIKAILNFILTNIEDKCVWLTHLQMRGQLGNTCIIM